MTGTYEEWKILLRRSFAIPHVVPDSLADRSIKLDLKKSIPYEADIDRDALAEVIIDVVINAASSGDLDVEWLPASLRGSYERGEWEPTPHHVLRLRILQRQKEWSPNPTQEIQTDTGTIALSLIDRLRRYIAQNDPVLDAEVPDNGAV
jgi:hypothetical protein